MLRGIYFRIRIQFKIKIEFRNWVEIRIRIQLRIRKENRYLDIFSVLNESTVFFFHPCKLFCGNSHDPRKGLWTSKNKMLIFKIFRN